MEYDFLDIGCSSGGSLAWGARYLGGRGLGIDLSPEKVERTRAAGQDAIVADARRLDFPDNAVRCVLFFDMLEHLPHAQLAQECVAEAYRVAREFVLIRGPNFDGEQRLRELGVKRYYTDWSGHKWHHRSSDLMRLVKAIGPHAAVLVSHQQLYDFGDSDLLPLSAPANSGRYDVARHGPKPSGALPIKLFSRIVAVLAKSPHTRMHDIALLATGSLVQTPDAAGDPPQAAA